MNWRKAKLEALGSSRFDALVVGGGINGAVSAAALAHRGARVALIDAGDFAGCTSQQTSNLAWGGIKYLESQDYLLVWDLCRSRNELVRSFPATVQEIRFLTTVSRGFRHHPLKLWAGAWLYWLFGRGATRPPRYLSPARISAEEPAVDVSDGVGGVEYSDAYLHDNDARFVWNFVRLAADAGCVALNYARSVAPARDPDGGWVCRVEDQAGNSQVEVKAKVLINAAGPYVDEHNEASGIVTTHRHVLSKGIHLMVERITDSQRVLAFFADDGRPFFAIPMYKHTCIGTTDTRTEDPQAPITDEDRDFVLDNVNKRLRLSRPLGKSDIIAERCGVRPLVVENGGDAGRDFLQLSRKHVVEVDEQASHISIFGGKLTDCVNVGEEVCAAVARLGASLRDHADGPMAGGRWYGEPGEDMRREYQARAASLDLDRLSPPGAYEPMTARLWRRYGHNALRLLDAIEADPKAGEILLDCSEYLRCELEYIAEREMVVKLDDFLRRRSKIAMVVRKEELRDSGGLAEACEILFGQQARARYDEYFGEDPRARASAVAS